MNNLLMTGGNLLADSGTPSLEPVVAMILKWGGAVLAFFAAVAAIYCAIMIVITALKAVRAEEGEEKRVYIKSIIWKVVWFFVAAGGSVIFGVLAATIGNAS